MQNNYRVFVDPDGKLNVLNTRQILDWNDGTYIAEVDSPWDVILPGAVLKRFKNPISNGLAVFSYEDGSNVALCPAFGDYVPPGYKYVSLALQVYLNRFSVRTLRTHVKVIPMRGTYLINPLLRHRGEMSYYISRNDLNLDIYGWTINNTSAGIVRFYRYPEGIRCTLDRTLRLTQRVNLEGITRLRVIIRAVDGPDRNVKINDIPLTPKGTGDYLYEGPELDDYAILGVDITNEILSGVEIRA